MKLLEKLLQQAETELKEKLEKFKPDTGVDFEDSKTGLDMCKSLYQLVIKQGKMISYLTAKVEILEAKTKLIKLPTDLSETVDK